MRHLHHVTFHKFQPGKERRTCRGDLGDWEQRGSESSHHGQLLNYANDGTINVAAEFGAYATR